ncbi:MAG: glucose-6-phosphate dehydrogenase [Nitrospira sp.]|nr:glucose-6-phosphate dehydrogenase [Nitrospira sp.]
MNQDPSMDLAQLRTPCVMIIFGIDGDLAKRKLLPALYNLMAGHFLPEGFAIVGLDRSETATEEFRAKLDRVMPEYLPKNADQAVWKAVSQRVHYLAGDFQEGATYRQLNGLLQEVDAAAGTHGNYIFYMATIPGLFGRIVTHLGEYGLTVERDGTWRRVIIEKPFGHDLDSAKALNHELQRVLQERQIYRIDHYLGKETVQNILVFRFANGIFEPMWNRRYIDHVQITVGESLGVEHRGRYYEQAGALRDMVPNHLLQLLCFLAMEPPNSFAADAVRDEKAKVLRGVVPLSSLDVLRFVAFGQYGQGLIDGKPVVGYRAEPHVGPESTTETFVSMKLFIDNWRWAGVPFYLRTGKRMTRRLTEIVVQFKQAPFMLFRKTQVDRLAPNVLVIRIQPDEGISLRFDAKVPGPTVRIGTVDMDFQYADYFGNAPQTGYETLLHDAMAGDATLFQRADNIELGWSVVQMILDVWKSLPGPAAFPNYQSGTWGPPEAEALLRREGREWWNGGQA